MNKTESEGKTETTCENEVDGLTCEELYNCCDCGGADCGCRYCWSCNACESCKGE